MSNRPESIYPYLVSATWVDSAPVGSILSWQVSDEIYLALVFDENGQVRNVRPADLDAHGLDESQAFDLAVRNLVAAGIAGQFSLGCATLLDGTEVGCARGNWMAPAAGLLFGNFHAALKEKFGVGAFAAVAVNQGCLFAFPTDDKTLASASLRQAIDDEFTGHPNPVSRSWLLLDGQWPRAFPGKQAF